MEQPMIEPTNDADRPEPTMERRRFLIVTALGGVGAFALGACSSDGSDTATPATTEPPPESTKPSTSAAESSVAATTPTTGATEEPSTTSPTETPSTTSPTDAVNSLEPAERPTVHLPFGSFGFPSPFASNGGIGYIEMSLIFDTLLWKDSTGELLPWLAKSVERSADNLTYTFELRDDVQWADGQPFTADDVVFTFDYYAQLEALPPPVVGQPPAGIAKVEASGPTTVTITIESPDVTFPEQVAGTIPIVPKHIWLTIADPTVIEDPALLVGTGAYRLESFTGADNPLLYVANDGYFLGTPFVKRIEFTGVDDQFTSLLSGATDSASGNGLRADILAQFENDDSYGIVTAQGATTSALYWNLTKGGALGDKLFRQACAMAIDSSDLVERVAGGNGQPGNAGFLGPENPFVAEVEQYEYDVEAANALLDSAGYTTGGDGVRLGPDGARVSYELLVSIADTPTADVLSAAFVDIGVETTIKSVEPGPQLFGAKFSGGYDMAILGFPGPSAGGPNGDPDLLRRVFSSRAPLSLTSASGYVNPAFDDLADEQRATFDVTQRMAIVAEMQRIIAEDIPILALYSPDTAFIFRKEVLDQWYLTPGRCPIDIDNRQLFITGVSTGTTIRPIKGG